MDVLEGLAQEIKVKYKIKNPWSLIYPALLGIDQKNYKIYNSIKTSSVGLGDAGLSTFAYVYTQNQIRHYRNLATDFTRELENADINVVKEVKAEVSKDLNLNKKVILIPHSQGNFVVNSAMVDLKLEPEFESRYRPILGVLHVATPSNLAPIAKNALFKLNSDIVVNNAVVRAISMAPTYQQEYYPDDSFAFVAGLNILQRFFTSGSTDILGHSMIKTYLSTTKKAKKIGGSTDFFFMSEIFKVNLIYVAKELEDNCTSPIVRFKSNSGVSVNGKLRINGFAGPERTISVTIDDIAVDEDSTIALQKGYDHSETTFTWEVETKHSSFGSDIQRGEGTSINFYLPYRDFEYTIRVTAKHGYKEVVYVQKIEFNQNKTPVASLISSECYIGPDGYNRNGTMSYLLELSDDEYAHDGRRMSGYVGREPTGITIADSANSTLYTLQSSCDVIEPSYHWKTSVTCQKGDINVCYGSCPELPPGAHDIVNTGLQWTTIIVYNEKNQPQRTIFLAEANNELGASYRTFVDPVNPLQVVTINVAGSCPVGGTGPQVFEF